MPAPSKNPVHCRCAVTAEKPRAAHLPHEPLRRRMAGGLSFATAVDAPKNAVIGNSFLHQIQRGIPARLGSTRGGVFWAGF